MNGPPGKAGGPFAATLTLTSSIPLAGEAPREPLLTTGAGLGPGSKSLLGRSLRTKVAESGRPGGSVLRGGEHAPPLTGDGPEEPFWLSGPLRGGPCIPGLPGIGLTTTGSSCRGAIFWLISSNLCLRLADSLFSSAISLSALRALSQFS